MTNWSRPVAAETQSPQTATTFPLAATAFDRVIELGVGPPQTHRQKAPSSESRVTLTEAASAAPA